ncbi:MAG: hypothetical protein IJ412_07945 [Oscillospiraceae bacterium]|nr:hypothetical protein [Oscillospiraceae bacterium]
MLDYENIRLISSDIKQTYVAYRKNGYSRVDAIARIHEENACALEDDDDRIAVLAGVTTALCSKNEMTDDYASIVLQEMHKSYKDEDLDTKSRKFLLKIEQQLSDRSFYGDEFAYKKTRHYVPDWQIGDTFAHTITHPVADELGISGWVILIHKIDEFVDDFEDHRQMVLVALCPPDKVPSNKEDLEVLGFLPMFEHDNGFEYLAQIEIKSKRAENGFELLKIGCFPGVSLPDDYCDTSPLTAMPLFGKSKFDVDRPSFEKQICLLYKRFTRPNPRTAWWL